MWIVRLCLARSACPSLRRLSSSDATAGACRGGRFVVPLQSHYNPTTAALQPHYSRITAALRTHYIPHYGLITAALQPHYGSHYSRATAALHLHYNSTTTPLQLRYNSATIPLHTNKTRNFKPGTAFGSFLPDHREISETCGLVGLGGTALRTRSSCGRMKR